MHKNQDLPTIVSSIALRNKHYRHNKIKNKATDYSFSNNATDKKRSWLKFCTTTMHILQRKTSLKAMSLLLFAINKILSRKT
jgi:hypothetical protein